MPHTAFITLEQMLFTVVPHLRLPHRPAACCMLLMLTVVR